MKKRNSLSVILNSKTLQFPNLDRHQRDARSHILKSQVESFLCHRPHLPDLRVEAKDSISKIRLREAFICSYGVHLEAKQQTLCPVLLKENPRRNPEPEPDPGTDLCVVGRPKARSGRKRLVCLQVKEVECFLAGAGDPRNGVTVSQGETQLHIHLRQNIKESLLAKPLVLG